MGYDKNGKPTLIPASQVVVDSSSGKTLKESIDNKELGNNVKNTLSGGETDASPSVAVVKSELDKRPTTQQVNEALDQKADKTAVNNKQDKLVSGQNIKTVGGVSLLGSGNISLPSNTGVNITQSVNSSDTANAPSGKAVADYVAAHSGQGGGDSIVAGANITIETTQDGKKRISAQLAGGTAQAASEVSFNNGDGTQSSLQEVIGGSANKESSKTAEDVVYELGTIATNTGEDGTIYNFRLRSSLIKNFVQVTVDNSVVNDLNIHRVFIYNEDGTFNRYVGLNEGTTAYTLPSSYEGKDVRLQFTRTSQATIEGCEQYIQVKVKNFPIKGIISEVRELQDTIDKDYIENPVVRGYLSNVGYDNSDYTYSEVSKYRDLATNYRKDQPLPVLLEWKNQGGESAITLYVTDNKGYAFTKVIEPTESSYALYNLQPNKTFTCKIVATYSDESTSVLLSRKVTPRGTIRMIKENSLRNIRDIGGWETVDGKTIKYGKIFRGSLLVGLPESEKQDLLDVCKVKAELDLQQSSEWQESSPLGNDVEYLTQEIGGEYGIEGNSQARKAFRKILGALRADKPLYIHCYGGADRTGTLMIWLEALLGLSEEDIVKDYELTSFSSYGLRVRSIGGAGGFNIQEHTIAGLQTEGRTPKQNAEIFWKVSNASEPAITDEEITEMRELLLT